MKYQVEIHGLTFRFDELSDLAVLYWDHANKARTTQALRVTKRDAAFQDGMALAYEQVAKFLEQVEEVR